MREDYTEHNRFWANINDFAKSDPHLKKLLEIPYRHQSRLVQEIPILTPGIYILTGGRQVGKSTLMKQIILRLLRENEIKPAQIYYLPCDRIDTYKQLLFELDQFKSSLKEDSFVLFLDEISYVKEWERSVKSIADMGWFEKGSVFITGSDTYLLKNAMMTFPGRRGEANKQDFHLYPLSFYEYIKLKDKSLFLKLNSIVAQFHQDFLFEIQSIGSKSIEQLKSYFNDYLLTGGYLRAINDFAVNQRIQPATYMTYIQWIIGDILKRGKDELFLREIITSLFNRLCSQITWHNLVSDLSIQHHQTGKDYVELLSRMDVTFILDALREDKLQPALKKAKKIAFNDPFIFHSLHSWLNSEQDPFELAKNILNSKSPLLNSLIEETMISAFRRLWETYYIKAEGEVDIAIVYKKKMLPIEVKNSLNMHEKDLKQILKYKRGYVAYAGDSPGLFKHLNVLPVPLVAMLAG